MRPERALSAAIISTVVALSLGFVHPFGNPRQTSAQSRADLLRDASISSEARDVLINKCADCHSETTHWPVYTRFAPVSWLTERDVTEGRKRLNLSHWQELSVEQRQTLSAEIVSEAKKDAMPLLSYRLIHRGVSLTREDVAALSALAPHVANDHSVLAGDPLRGQAVFEKRCTGCHDLNSNREGPHLRGVYGRKAGSVADFAYSSALAKSGLIWNDANLEKWLIDTDVMMPESNMGFSVPNAQDRFDLIAFLKNQR